MIGCENIYFAAYCLPAYLTCLKHKKSLFALKLGSKALFSLNSLRMEMPQTDFFFDTVNHL